MARSLLMCFLVVVFICMEVTAQDSIGIALHGSAGVYGELYSMKGIPTRRPHATGRIFFRGDLSVNGAVFPLDIFLSSEDDALRQTINRLSLGYRNTWIDVRAGDAYPVHSPLLINGAFLRGVHVGVTHDGVFLKLAGGQNQRAVEGNLQQGVIGMYRRFLYAGSAGYDDGGFSGALHFLRGKDEISSINTPGYFTTPQENLIVGVTGGASAFSRALKLKAEVNRSLWTRDIRELPLERGGLPGAFTSLFSERPSSISDLAFRTDIAYQHQGTSVSGLYQRIGSDYYSMGVFGFQPDWQEFRVQAMAPLVNYTLNLSAHAGTRRDNLNGKRSATTTRSNGGVNAGYRIDDTYAVNANYSVFLDRNDAVQAVSRIDQISHSIALQPSRDWGETNSRQHADLMLGYQSTSDRVARQFGSMGYTRVSAGGTYSRVFGAGRSAYCSYHFSRNRSSVITLVSHTVTAGGSMALIPGRLTTNGQFAYGAEFSDNGSIGSARIQVRVSGIYTITETVQAQCDLDGTFYRATVSNGLTYTELRTSLTISKRF